MTTTARKSSVSSKPALANSYDHLSGAGRRARGLPDNRNQRVRLALVVVVFFPKSRTQYRFFRLYSPLRENRSDDQRQDRSDGRAVNDRPCERHQECTRVNRMPQVAIKTALD